MSIRSEVRDLLNGRPGATVPWFGDLSYFYDSLERRGELEAKHRGPEGEKRFYADFGVGIYLYTPDAFTISYTEAVRYTEIRTPDRITMRYDTPAGSIESVQDYVPGMYCFAYTKHFVETIEDVRVMRAVFESSRYGENYGEYLSRDRLWGEDGIGFAMAVASMAPLQKMLSRWAGVETTVALCEDHPEEIAETFSTIEESQDELVEVLAGSPAEVVILPENLASQVVGERYFRKFDMPYYTRIVRRLHAAGKKVAIHIDGGLKPCLGLLGECGFRHRRRGDPVAVRRHRGGGPAHSSGTRHHNLGRSAGRAFLAQLQRRLLRAVRRECPAARRRKVRARRRRSGPAGRGARADRQGQGAGGGQPQKGSGPSWKIVSPAR